MKYALAALLAALAVAGCASGPSVFGNEPNPYACSDHPDWQAQINLCRDSPSK